MQRARQRGRERHTAAAAPQGAAGRCVAPRAPLTSLAGSKVTYEMGPPMVVKKKAKSIPSRFT